MDDQDVRMECLRLATEACGTQKHEIVQTAERLYRWVRDGVPVPGMTIAVDGLSDDVIMTALRASAGGR